MDAVLAFVPEKECIQYSAITGQSLYCMGEMDLKHNVLPHILPFCSLLSSCHLRLNYTCLDGYCQHVLRCSVEPRS